MKGVADGVVAGADTLVLMEVSIRRFCVLLMIERMGILCVDVDRIHVIGWSSTRVISNFGSRI